MSYHVFFSFSTGIKKPLVCPKGTRKEIWLEIQHIEKVLGAKRYRYLKNPTYWRDFQFDKVTDEVLCKTIEIHNDWVRRMYNNFQEWFEKPPEKNTEVITERQASQFWFGFHIFGEIEPSRWTGDYYRTQMDHLYEVMRGRDNNGVSFDAKALTPEQAAAVIRLFSFLDPEDFRLDVPKGYDHLASSYDGGYDWCEKCCAAIHPDERGCKKRKCPVRAEYIE